MKCPLTYDAYSSEDGQRVGEWDSCLEAECAWWYKDNSCCSILTLAQGSIYIHKAALSIERELTLLRPK